MSLKKKLIQQPKPQFKLLPISESPEPSELNEADAAQIIVVDSLDSRITEVSFGEELKIEKKSKGLSSFMENWYDAYYHGCVCGTRYNNNCAHFLSNACYPTASGFPRKYAKCPAGRLIRAKEMLQWFRSFSTGFAENHNRLGSAIWFVYEEYAGQAHVCLHREAPSRYSWKGTANYPSWPVQWHYYY